MGKCTICDKETDHRVDYTKFFSVYICDSCYWQYLVDSGLWNTGSEN